MPAKSKAQQAAAAIALHGKPKAGSAAANMKKGMSDTELEKFATTKKKGLPKHVESVNVIDDFKSLSFTEFLGADMLTEESKEKTDEGVLDFAKGAARRAGGMVRDKWNQYASSGAGGTMSDIWQAGKTASASADVMKQLQGQVAALAKLAQTPGGKAALMAALKGAAAPAPAPAATAAAPTGAAPAATAAKPAARPDPGTIEVSPQERQRITGQKPMRRGPGARFGQQQKPVRRAARGGQQPVTAGMETPVLGKFLADGVLDFIGGAGKAIGQKVAQSAPVQAGKQVIQAGRQASSDADANKVAEVAQNIIAMARKMPNGVELLKQMLAKMGAMGRVLAAYIQQISKPRQSTPPPAAAPAAGA